MDVEIGGSIHDLKWCTVALITVTCGEVTWGTESTTWFAGIVSIVIEALAAINILFTDAFTIDKEIVAWTGTRFVCQYEAGIVASETPTEWSLTRTAVFGTVNTLTVAYVLIGSANSTYGAT